ncbi:YceI family protein [Lentzea sp. JNUCC 0626]|uniref:YceI family protein n=1 Tax=Lentzea sp. JNUCC 0626 TaxID=3367513 RepID=UPI003748FD7E
MTITATTDVPGYLAGTWDIDPTHSDVSFSVRHLMVGKVRGRFADFSGQIVTGAQIEDSVVTASIRPASIDTGNSQRDAHVRSADFFDVERHPHWTFHSTGVRLGARGLVLDGSLTIKGVTRAVALALEFNGIGVDDQGGTRLGVSASTAIDRNDFGVDIKLPLDGGGVVVGDKVQITLDVEAVLRRT